MPPRDRVRVILTAGRVWVFLTEYRVRVTPILTLPQTVLSAMHSFSCGACKCTGGQQIRCECREGVRREYAVSNRVTLTTTPFAVQTR